MTFKMINLDDYRANSQNFHELAKLIFFVESVFMDFLSLCFFRLVWFKEQLCLSQMMYNLKIGGI